MERKARKIFRVTKSGHYLGTYSTLGKAIKSTGYTSKSGWHSAYTTDPNAERLWETYTYTGYEIEELIVR